MNFLQRWFWISWWVLKKMILELSPIRRLLVTLAIILFLTGYSVQVNGDQIRISNEVSIGVVLLILVIMLELKDKLLVRDELEAGRKVQRALMPEQCPYLPGWSLWLYTHPANEVGGDLVDFLRINETQAAISIADISGKGLQAALLTAKLQATIRALATGYSSPAELVSHINKIFHRDSLPSSFASLLYIEIRPNSSDLHFVNAGHLPPLLLNNNGLQELAKGELALGLADEAHYTENKLQVETGNIFLAYSDGVSEARNEQGDFFSSERFHKILPSLYNLPVNQIGQQIIQTIERFIGEAPANDDISLVILKRI
jgi:sigma-B regulation protein RsbU (phosphoserine phosphatase)